MTAVPEWVVGKGRNRLNLFRLILACLVIVSHSHDLSLLKEEDPLTLAFGTISFGAFAVDLFFLISGYLIVKSWLTKPDILLFLKNRISRIYPGFLAASAISVVVCALVLSVPLGRFDFGNVFGLALGALTLAPPNPPFGFEGGLYPGVNVPLWSIRYEFVCYLLVPAVMVFSLRKRAWVAFALLFTVLHVIGELERHQAGGLSFLAGSVIRLPMFFFIGGCFYLYFEGMRPRASWLLAAAVGLWFSFSVRWLAEPALAVLGGYLVFSLAWFPHFFDATEKKRPDISYGVYLYGWPISKCLFFYFPATPAMQNASWSVLMALVCGYFSWVLVESRFLQKRKAPLGVQAVSKRAVRD